MFVLHSVESKTNLTRNESECNSIAVIFMVVSGIAHVRMRFQFNLKFSCVSRSIMLNVERHVYDLFPMKIV